MSMRFRFVPPKRDARLVVHAAVPAATRAGAEVLLEKSRPLVPVDTGALKASGKVTQEGDRAAVSYEGIAPDGYDYGIRQHEDLALHHDQGQAKFLESPLHSEHDAVRAAMLEALGKALGL